MDNATIRQSNQPTAAQRQAILDGLIAFSDPRAGPRAWPEHVLCLVIRDPDGAVEGGLWGRAYYEWLFIELIFVPESRRGQALGSALLAMAETQARAWNCHGIWLDTFSFQAPAFYQKKGFVIFGEIPDYPSPHRRFLLSKAIDRGADLASHAAVDLIGAPEPHHRQAISRPLNRFNDASLGGGAWPDADLALIIEDAAGAVIGGLWGCSYYQWLFIELLFVPESLRGQGTGTTLLRMAEAEAQRRGCVGVWLDTFSFQARGFYERHGYHIIGEIADYPAPHRRFFLTKRL